MKTTRKVALIGYGYWGKNILRNLIEAVGSSSIFVVEQSEFKRNQLTLMYPSVVVYSNTEELYNNFDIDAFIIATESKSHYAIAKDALERGKHVLVEKPMTTSLDEALELHEIAKANQLVLMVDHIFLYHPVVRKMKEYFTADFLGKISYIDTTRVNLGIYQNDINVLWDLACHDISIVNYLICESPAFVQAIGKVNPEFGVEDVAYLFLFYSSGLMVQINSSWASPVKIRKMIVGGTKRMLIYDDIEPSNKLIIYEYERTLARDVNKESLSDYRLGNISIPKYEQKESLASVIEDFLSCIETKKTPLADSVNAIEVIKILEKAQDSLRLGGIKLPLL